MFANHKVMCTEDSTLFTSDNGKYLVLEKKNGDVYVNNLSGEKSGYTLFVNKTAELMDELYVPPRTLLQATHELLKTLREDKTKPRKVELIFCRWDVPDSKLYISVKYPAGESPFSDEKMTFSFSYNLRGVEYFEADSLNEEAEKTLIKCRCKDDPNYRKLHISFSEKIDRLLKLSGGLPVMTQNGLITSEMLNELKELHDISRKELGL